MASCRHGCHPIAATQPRLASQDLAPIDFNDYRLRKWAKACRLRDRNTCLMCGRVGGPIEVHHCKPKSAFPELAYRLDNGATLCYSCHRVVCHRGDTFDASLCLSMVPLFRYFMRLAYRRRWNLMYQERI